MKFIDKLKTSFFEDYNSWILWIPIIFGLGIIFYFSYPNNYYIFPFCLFTLSTILIFLFKNHYLRPAIIAIAVFLAGFLWAKFYSEKIAYTPTIEHKFYATAIGKIDNVKSFNNSFLKRKSYRVILKDVSLHKAGTIANDILIKKAKPKQIKKKQKKPKRKKSKRNNKTIIKNYLNVDGYQEINREFLAVDYKSQNYNWLDNRYLNPPKKITFNVNTKLNNAKIGDIIQTRVVLEPLKEAPLLGGYDQKFNNYFKGIGASGYAASDLKILRTGDKESFLQKIKILRQNIAKKILDQTSDASGGITVALLVGDKNFIPADVLNNVRNSGLAHLLAISGLHFALASGLFFISIRFLLSLNQDLVIHYNIKKISAFIAIFAGGFYLLLAGMPIPAIRAFIVVTLIFLAVLFDLRPNPFRFTAFAALTILILSPNVIFSVSFQLSFTAIIALIVLADVSKKYHINSSDRPFYLKFFFYFLGIIFSSLVATIATTPFSIYYFNNFITLGFLANLVAIPIASFITMPCGFLSLLLMPFGAEKITLYPMQISINWIIDIANFIVSISGSYMPVKIISDGSFISIIFGFLWFCLWQKKWRFLGVIPVICGIYFAYQTPIPNLLIDKEKKMIAFYNEGKLIFLKPTKSKQALIWAKKLGLEKITNIDDLSEAEKQKLEISCTYGFCQFVLQKKRVLVLRGRNKIANICQKNDEVNYNLVININNKYQSPTCLKKIKTN
jgi:ComEC/Rec2-related protein